MCSKLWLAALTSYCSLSWGEDWSGEIQIGGSYSRNTAPAIRQQLEDAQLLIHLSYLDNLDFTGLHRGTQGDNRDSSSHQQIEDGGALRLNASADWLSSRWSAIFRTMAVHDIFNTGLPLDLRSTGLRLKTYDGMLATGIDWTTSHYEAGQNVSQGDALIQSSLGSRQNWFSYRLQLTSLDVSTGSRPVYTAHFLGWTYELDPLEGPWPSWISIEHMSGQRQYAFDPEVWVIYNSQDKQTDFWQTTWGWRTSDKLSWLIAFGSSQFTTAGGSRYRNSVGSLQLSYHW